MKILVTGATGFIGKQLSDVLTNSGHEARCTSRKHTSEVSALRELITCDLETAVDVIVRSCVFSYGFAFGYQVDLPYREVDATHLYFVYFELVLQQ